MNGINLAFAVDIASEMNAKLNAEPKRLHYKRLCHLQKHFFGLEALLCPSGKWGGVPSPKAVFSSLRQIWADIGPGSVRHGDHEIDFRRHLEPTFRVLHDSHQLTSGPAVRLNHLLERPLITFISGRTDDDRTPHITAAAPFARG